MWANSIGHVLARLGKVPLPSIVCAGYFCWSLCCCFIPWFRERVLEENLSLRNVLITPWQQTNLGENIGRHTWHMFRFFHNQYAQGGHTCACTCTYTWRLGVVEITHNPSGYVQSMLVIQGIMICYSRFAAKQSKKQHRSTNVLEQKNVAFQIKELNKTCRTCMRINMHYSAIVW